VLDRLFESVRLSREVLVIVDSPDDTIVPVPPHAIRFGIDAVAAPVAVAAASRYMPGGQ
jgi:hypothetical protein